MSMQTPQNMYTFFQMEVSNLKYDLILGHLEHFIIILAKIQKFVKLIYFKDTALVFLFFDYRRQHNLRIKVARIFNTYGPKMHPNDGRVVSNFIMQALQNKPITIYGDGQQSRSFCYVSDLVEIFIRFIVEDIQCNR